MGGNNDGNRGLHRHVVIMVEIRVHTAKKVSERF
jgi:hypothetical protein